MLFDAWNRRDGYALLVALSRKETVDLVQDVAAL